jgi:nucleotide-binding universal stress UspA family protein
MLLHVIPEPAKGLDRVETAEGCRKSMQQRFGPTLTEQIPQRYLVAFGDPASQVLAFAEEFRPELIAFGVRPAGELAIHFRTTTAYRIMLNARCPVLIMPAADH